MCKIFVWEKNSTPHPKGIIVRDVVHGQFLGLRGRRREPGELSRYSDWLRAERPSFWRRSPSRVLVRTGPGAHPAAFPMGTRSTFLGGKAADA
jgi:hypothetical protein